MKTLLIATLIGLLYGCSVETKDGCSSTGNDTTCTPTEQNKQQPEVQEPQLPETEPEVKDNAVSGVCYPSHNRGCLKGQIAHSSSIMIGDSWFNDANEFARYIIHMLYDTGEEVDADGDGNLLQLKTSFSNKTFARGFNVAIVGSEIRDPYVYHQQGSFIANQLLPGEYMVRVYKEFDLVEKDDAGKVTAQKCLQLEYVEGEIQIYAEEEYLMKPINTFDIKIFDASCNGIMGSDYRDVVLPTKEEIVLPEEDDTLEGNE